MPPLTRVLCIASAMILAPCVRDGSRQPRGVAAAQSVSDARGAGSVSGEADGTHQGQGQSQGQARDASVLAADVVRVPNALADVIEAVRREDWPAARDRLTRLPDSDQATPEGRYLGGRIAMALRDYPRAATLLHGLGEQLTPLANEIARTEAQALANTGRHAEARALYEQLFARTHATRDRARAAEEAQAQGDNAAAAAVMRDWPADAPAGIDRARAWLHAAQALEAVNDAPGAVRAYKRILVDEPDARAADEARAALARHNAALSADETLARVANLNARARYTDAIAELNALPAGTLPGALETRRIHLLGRALFSSRNHYADAYTTLRAASQRPDNPDRDEDAFLAARALARADRDDDAIAEYDRVARATTGRWSDEAAYRAAWLVAHHDRIDAAVDRLRAFLRDRPDAAGTLRPEAAWELGWMLYNAGRFADAVAALEQSSELSNRALERGRGRYWAAMARARRGDTDGAFQGFRAIIADRPITYYALLAEARLRERGQPVPPPAAPAPRRPAPQLQLPPDVQLLRALGFEREGGALLAAQEDSLRAQLPADRADEVIALAYLELGEEHRAYTLAQRHNELLDHEPTPEGRWTWDCAYPRPYAHWVEAAEDQNHLPRHYLYAIMRQESAFNTRDVSNARAMGLLQMIPPTTRRVAQELGIEYREDLLYEPSYNIRTGGYYIGRLFAQYGGVLPRAIGAFNAGPGAMGRWVNRWPDLELDAFVERIPFDETRTYVRRVMQNLARYRYLYGPRGTDWPLRVELQMGQRVQDIVDY